MKKYLVWLLLTGLMASCAYVSLGPGLRFPATNWQKVLVCEYRSPFSSFIILSRMTIDVTWSMSTKDNYNRIKRSAASIGGDAVVISDVYVDILAFNRGATTTGTVTALGNDLYFFRAVTRPNMTYVPIKILYGYVIKQTTGEAFEENAAGQIRTQPAPKSPIESLEGLKERVKKTEEELKAIEEKHQRLKSKIESMKAEFPNARESDVWKLLELRDEMGGNRSRAGIGSRSRRSKNARSPTAQRASWPTARSWTM